MSTRPLRLYHLPAAERDTDGHAVWHLDEHRILSLRRIYRVMRRRQGMEPWEVRAQLDAILHIGWGAGYHEERAA